MFETEPVEPHDTCTTRPDIATTIILLTSSKGEISRTLTHPSLSQARHPGNQPFTPVRPIAPRLSLAYLNHFCLRLLTGSEPA